MRNGGLTANKLVIDKYRHDYTIGTLDMLKVCDACADMGLL